MYIKFHMYAQGEAILAAGSKRQCQWVSILDSRGWLLPFVIDFLLFAGGGLVELWGDKEEAEGPMGTASSFRGAALLAGCSDNCCFPFCIFLAFPRD